jgi:hypothetical protein
MYEDLLADQQRVLGPDHPSTMATQSVLLELPGLAGPNFRQMEQPTEARLQLVPAAPGWVDCPELAALASALNEKQAIVAEMRILELQALAERRKNEDTEQRRAQARFVFLKQHVDKYGAQAPDGRPSPVVNATVSITATSRFTTLYCAGT